MDIRVGSAVASFDEKGAYLRELRSGNDIIIKKTFDGTETHGGAVVFFPFGNRVKNAEYKYKDVKYNLPKNDGNNSIHGLIRNETFDYKKTENGIEFYKNFENNSYPGRAFIKINYEMKNKSFNTYFYVKSLDREIPVEIGFHPYFYINGSYSIDYNKDLKMMNYMDTYFPDGTYTDMNFKNKDLSNIILDNAFYLDNDIVLKDEKHTVKIIRYNMPYTVLYNGLYANGDSIAIEPMTGAPDAFNNGIGLINLKKDQEFKCGYSIEF